MNYSPLEFQESLEIGQVDFVSPDEIKVQLNIDAPENVALSTGKPRVFPRINGYVLIHTEEGYVVGQIEWITVEKSPYPKRQGLGDFGLVDLPFPLRKMSVNPLGVLKEKGDKGYSFRRGVSSFPSVGDNVLLPTDEQLKAIIESGENRFVEIGNSPFAESAKVAVDPDKLFGRHLAVLGNTGSGKSCSVAGLIRWSLEAAGENPNARFIILDPNGEYKKAFADDHNVRYFSVNDEGEESRLKVPLWFWNSNEWCAFAQASGKTQRPILRRALKDVKSGRRFDANLNYELKLRRFLSFQYFFIQNAISTNQIKEDSTKFGKLLKVVSDDLDLYKKQVPTYNDVLASLQKTICVCLSRTYGSFNEKGTGKVVEYYNAFSESDVFCVTQEIKEILDDHFGGFIYEESEDENSPLEFNGADLVDYIQQLSVQEKVTQYLDFLVMRIQTMISDEKTKRIVDEGEVHLDEWLKNYIGDNSASNGSITIIDLSLVPAELVHILTAVIARMTFEALQRYRKMNSKCLPTVLVMEEAHTFVKRYVEDAENQSASEMCCKVFEKIAREGRKFGLGMVLSSQRPSELSPTVLSQCNTFLLHRISNDKDQELVMRLIPDNQRGLLRDLPSLPSQNAIILGWASELPMLVKMRYLPEKQRPQSDDPDFWKVWTKENDRSVDWTAIANEWQGNN